MRSAFWEVRTTHKQWRPNEAGFPWVSQYTVNGVPNDNALIYVRSVFREVRTTQPHCLWMLCLTEPFSTLFLGGSPANFHRDNNGRRCSPLIPSCFWSAVSVCSEHWRQDCSSHSVSGNEGISENLRPSAPLVDVVTVLQTGAALSGRRVRARAPYVSQHIGTLGFSRTVFHWIWFSRGIFQRLHGS